MLGILPEDLDTNFTTEQIIFPKNEETEFVCLEVKENREKEYFLLKCRVMTGPHANKVYSIFMNQKRTYPITVRKLREFGLAFYTMKELREGDQPLSRLCGRKFNATPKEAREYNGKWFQDFSKWKDLGEAPLNPDIHIPTQTPAIVDSADTIPF